MPEAKKYIAVIVFVNLLKYMISGFVPFHSRHSTMVFVSSAVLGAAAGTGLALLVAVTIVMYRYYVVRRKGKEWAELDRLEEKKAARKINLQV